MTQEDMGFGHQCWKDAQAIGAHLRNELNMRPAAIMQKDENGIFNYGNLPAPSTPHTVDVLKITGRGSVTL